METRLPYADQRVNAVGGPAEETPSSGIIRQAVAAYNEFENRLNFMRRERDEMNNMIRELEQKAADLSGILNKSAMTPGSIHPQVGIR